MKIKMLFLLAGLPLLFLTACPPPFVATTQLGEVIYVPQLNVLEGRLERIPADSEYSLDDGASWQSCDGTSIVVSFQTGDRVWYRPTGDTSNERFLGEIDEGVLVREGYFQKGEIAKRWHACSNAPVSGWNAALGLPKEDDRAIAAGSVFFFEYLGDNPDSLSQRLKCLESAGLGERRSEGFGRVIVCDPFHWEVNELWKTL